MNPIAETFAPVDYASLNGKQQETYNFQRAAAALVTYGFKCMFLRADALGADFLAHHMLDGRVLPVQLKGRVSIDKKYLGRPDLWLMCPIDDAWLLIPHITLVDYIKQSTSGGLETADSWVKHGYRHMKRPSRKLFELLRPWLLTNPESTRDY